MDYYLEIERKDAIREEDQALLEEKEGAESWQFQLAALYLLCKLQQIQSAVEYGERIARLEKQLLQEGNTVCVRNTEAITCIHLVDAGEPEKLVRWLRSFAADTIEVREDNYVMLYCQAKDYMLETIILQDISHGLSNTDISKVQAILKGKEMGVLK